MMEVSSGELVIFSVAADGVGPYSMPLFTARPGFLPPVHGPPPSSELDPGLLLPSVHTAYKLKVRWYTELDEDNCFARWLSAPSKARRLNNDPRCAPHHQRRMSAFRGAFVKLLMDYRLLIVRAGK